MTRNRTVLRAAGLSALLLLAVPSGAAASAGPAATAPPLQGRVVALDPGHDLGNATHLAEIARPVFIGNATKPCNTTGTSTDAGYPESTFTMAVADALAGVLRAQGATVVLTRTSEDASTYGPCVDDRGRFGASVHADLMLSLHGDGAPAGDRGFHVIRPGIVPGYTDDVYAASGTLQRAVIAGLAGAGYAPSNYLGVGGADTRTDLGTLNLSDVPVVMAELGNMRDPVDAAEMTSPAGRARLAAGLAAGITSYLAGAPRTTPWPIGDIAAAYARLGGTASVLGVPRSGELTAPDGAGRFTVFERGALYWTPATGAHEVHGDIQAEWARLRWEQGVLGYPTSDELTAPDGLGRYSVFQRGAVYWTPGTGAHEVHGDIQAEWARLRWEQGALGYPTSDELPAPDGAGRYSRFQHGVISWTARTGAHAVPGAPAVG